MAVNNLKEGRYTKVEYSSLLILKVKPFLLTKEQLDVV